MNGRTVVFFDGVCGLCNGLVRFLLRRDRTRSLLFSPLQGRLARATFARHGLDPADLDSVVLISGIDTDNERIYVKSRAVLQTLDILGGVWRAIARLARVIPVPLADGVYQLVARTRYRTFGRFDACPIPPPAWRDRFLE